MKFPSLETLKNQLDEESREQPGLSPYFTQQVRLETAVLQLELSYDRLKADSKAIKAAY